MYWVTVFGLGGWGDGLWVKSTYCSSKGTELGFHYTRWGPHNCL